MPPTAGLASCCDSSTAAALQRQGHHPAALQAGTVLLARSHTLRAAQGLDLQQQLDALTELNELNYEHALPVEGKHARWHPPPG